jgi:transglutaminase-like putative cysteine protease
MRVKHTTRYVYEAPVFASYNEARISPLDTPSQFTLEHRVEVQPAANLFRYRDYWGSRVHAFDLHHEHTELEIVGTSLVETAERTPSLDTSVTWTAIDAAGMIDRFYEYLGSTPVTVADGAIREVAAGLRDTCPTPADALVRLGEWLRGHITYEPGSTDVSTTAAQVLRNGRGVCQDYVHLGLAVLRAAGIPARYASGYLYPALGGEVGVTFEGESHAWLDAWVGDWHPVDPTSGAPVAEHHVLVARGRDYSDVTPLKGVYHGGPGRSLDVTVELTRVA